MRFYILIFIFFVFSLFSKPLEIDLFAKNAILIDAKTKKILFEKRAFEKAYPASITKIATALYVLDQKKELLDEYVKATEEALYIIDSDKKKANNYRFPAYYLEPDGTSFDLKKGEIIKLNTLLYALMLISGNDAANVIAENISGTIPLFMKELNSYITNLGCKDTFFLNPHGLHHPDHKTTAYDMAVVTQRAMQIPKFRHIVSTLSYTTSKTNRQNRKEIKQYNRLMKEGKYYYPFATGVKTGYHSLANYNLVAAAEYKDRSLIAVLLGGEKAEYRYIDAKRLFDKAFAEEKQNKTIFDKNKTFLAKIDGAKSSLEAYLIKDFIYNYYPSEEGDIKAYIVWGDLRLPIKKDQLVGYIELKDESNALLQKEPIYSKEDVKKKFFRSIKDFILKMF